MLSSIALVLFSCTQTVQETEYFDYPVMTLSVTELDLEEVRLGETNTARFTVRNEGDLSMGISDVYIGAGVEIEGEFTVRAIEKELYCLGGAVEDAADTGAEADAKSMLSPTSDAQLELSATTLDFGVVDAGLSSTLWITITSAGLAPLEILDSTLAGSPAFSALNNPVGVYDVGDSLNLFITYSPTDTDGDLATLTLTSNDADTPSVEITLLGNDPDIDTGLSDDTGEPGGADDSGFDTGDTGDTGLGERDAQILFELGAGCSVPVEVTYAPTRIGQVYSSVVVETHTQQREDGEEPDYYADFVSTEQIVLIGGVGSDASGNLIVLPRNVNFGHLWPGESAARYVEFYNAGAGDLLLTGAELDSSNCNAGFEISYHYSDVLQAWVNPEDASVGGHVLPAGQRTLVEVTFSPLDDTEAYCTMQIHSDDEDMPSVYVSIQGNVGDDPGNTAPSVAILSPEMAYVHETSDPLVMKIKVSDPDQPVDTLVCKVSSAILVEARVADCAPSDDSGYVEVEVDMKYFDPGVDTLLVTVTDSEELSAYDSISVMIQSPADESDDDGDGFGDGDEAFAEDCDDSYIYTYPEAAEIADGRDNDCDFLIDENTNGYDDDGDRFSDDDNDCNDNDVEIYPGAPEAPDNKDNDCDGVVDENTALFDDDGDGYAEANNDCDDDDPDRNPSVEEVCDTIDQNCNGIVDDGCIVIDGEPYIYGGILRAQTAVEEGETILLEVNAYDPDGQELSYAWTLKDGAGSIDDVSAPSVFWTAPELDSNSSGQIFDMYVLVTDAEGKQTWAFSEVTVFPQADLYKRYRVDSITQVPLCGVVSLSSAGGLLLGLSALIAVRRRED